MDTVLRPVRRRVGAGADRVWRRVEDDEAEGQQRGCVCGGWSLLWCQAETFVLGAIKPLQGSEHKSSDLELSMEVSFLEGQVCLQRATGYIFIIMFIF